MHAYRQKSSIDLLSLTSMCVCNEMQGRVLNVGFELSKTVTPVTVYRRERKYTFTMGKNVKESFGAAVAKRRTACGLSKQKLALMVDVNRLTIRRIESGDANPTLDVLLRIAEGLDIPLSELLDSAERASGDTDTPARQSSIRS